MDKWEIDMLVSIKEKEDMKDSPTGTETWQTKATQKGKVPRYYSPVELLSMRIDTLEEQVRNLNTRLSNLTSDHLTPIKDEDL